MRRRVHKLLGIGLSLCLVLGGAFGPALTGYAEDTARDEIVTLDTSEGTQTAQEETAQSEAQTAQNEETNTDVEENGGSGQEGRPGRTVQGNRKLLRQQKKRQGAKAQRRLYRRR